MTGVTMENGETGAIWIRGAAIVGGATNNAGVPGRGGCC